MVCEPLYLKWGTVFFPGLLNSIQRDFDCGGSQMLAHLLNYTLKHIVFLLDSVCV